MPRRSERKRKIQPSVEGRLTWMPGEDMEHALDVMFEYAEQAAKDLERLVQEVRKAIGQTDAFVGGTEALAAKDEEAERLIARYFEIKKHHIHVQAIFTRLRHMRQANRLRAVLEVLDLAQLLLNEVFAEDPMIEDLLMAMEGEAQIQARLVGTAQFSRDRMGQYTERLRALRSQLSLGNGWYEYYTIQKQSLHPAILTLLEVIKLIRAGDPIPVELLERVPAETRPYLNELEGEMPLQPDLQEIVDAAYYGPYIKYRWYDTEDRRQYTIALGKVKKLVEGGEEDEDLRVEPPFV